MPDPERRPRCIIPSRERGAAILAHNRISDATRGVCSGFLQDTSPLSDYELEEGQAVHSNLTARIGECAARGICAGPVEPDYYNTCEALRFTGVLGESLMLQQQEPGTD